MHDSRCRIMFPDEVKGKTQAPLRTSRNNLFCHASGREEDPSLLSPGKMWRSVATAREKKKTGPDMIRACEGLSLDLELYNVGCFGTFG